MNIDKFKDSERLFEMIPELKDCNGDYRKVNRGYFFVIRILLDRCKYYLARHSRYSIIKCIS